MMERLLDLEENKHDIHFYEVGCFSQLYISPAIHVPHASIYLILSPTRTLFLSIPWMSQWKPYANKPNPPRTLGIQ